jgi:hypothetical protein
VRDTVKGNAMAHNKAIEMLYSEGLLWDITLDPWGSAENATIELCFALERIGYGMYIPFQFSAGAMFWDTFETHEDYETVRNIVDIVDTGEVTLSECVFALRVLDRYLDLCKLAGRDY